MLGLLPAPRQWLHDPNIALFAFRGQVLGKRRYRFVLTVLDDHIVLLHDLGRRHVHLTY